MRKICKALLPMLLLALTAVAVWITWGNAALTVTEVTVENERVPIGFSGFRIAQVSDLHNTSFGKGNCHLLEKLREISPDIIVITGDLVDSRRTDLEAAVDFARQAAEIAPCYYITGNHESRIEEYPILRDALVEAGVTVLENERAALTRNGDTITLLGMVDPSFRGLHTQRAAKTLVEETIADLQQQEDGFIVLLAHRPEHFLSYTAAEVDLVLCGHAHGGQIRLPWIGGLFAPGQGVLPKYDSGAYQNQNTTMIVSRGLGNSLFPFRVNNRPEIVVVTLES